MHHRQSRAATGRKLQPELDLKLSVGDSGLMELTQWLGSDLKAHRISGDEDQPLIQSFGEPTEGGTSGQSGMWS